MRNLALSRRWDCVVLAVDGEFDKVIPGGRVTGGGRGGGTLGGVDCVSPVDGDCCEA